MESRLAFCCSMAITNSYNVDNSEKYVSGRYWERMLTSQFSNHLLKDIFSIFFFCEFHKDDVIDKNRERSNEMKFCVNFFLPLLSSFIILHLHLSRHFICSTICLFDVKFNLFQRIYFPSRRSTGCARFVRVERS